MKKGAGGCSAQFAFLILQFLVIAYLAGSKYVDQLAAAKRRDARRQQSSEAAKWLRAGGRSASALSASNALDGVDGASASAPVDSIYEPLCQLELDKQPGHGPPSLIDFSVASAFDQRGRRDAIRDGWGKLARSMGMRVRFFVGAAAPEDVHGAASRAAESRKHGDLVILNMTDSYDALTSKTLAMLVYSARCGNGQFVGKVDEDVFVWVARLAKRLSRLEMDSAHDGLSSKLGVYLGNFWTEMKAIKDKGNKNHEGRYMGDTFPPYAAGPVYFLSRPIVEYLARNAPLLNTRWHNEDMALGTWLLGTDTTYLNEFHLKILGWKHHERPFLAEHATDINPYASVEEWQAALAGNFSTPEAQLEAPGA